LFFWLLYLPFGHAALLLSPSSILIISCCYIISNHLTNSVETDQ
jgi:hypothetical protein